MAGAYLGYTVTIVETSRIPVIASSATSIETEAVNVAIEETFDNI
jgi:diacylglycerol kinase